MSKIKNYSHSIKLTAALAMLVSISIVLGKYLALSVGDVLRFSFENLPIIFAGIAFGPIAAFLVAITADLIGCLLVAYAINPVVTLGAAALGLVSGFLPQLLRKHTSLGEKGILITTVAISHIIGSVIIKTFGLAVFYDMPILLLMLWRLINYSIVATCEALLLWILLNRDGVQMQIEKIKPKSK